MRLCNAFTLSYLRVPCLVDRLCCALFPGPLHWTSDAPCWPPTCSRIGGEELYYGGPVAELHLLHCCRHVYMVRWYCRPVVRAFTVRGYACV